MFGKSNFNTEEGFDRWFQGAFLGNGGTWEDNEAPGFHYKAAQDEYATALLGNKTVEWLRRDNVTGQASGGRPFFAYFAPHCPHTPAAPADWYADACEGVTSQKDWDAWATDHSKPMPDEVEYFKKCDPNVPRLKPISHSDYLGGAGWFPIGTFL